MVRLAIVSDIHGDVHALRDALARIDALGVELVVCAGDVVDYGTFPEETIALLRDRRIECVRSNHDRWTVEAHSNVWDLSAEALAFLRAMPVAWRSTIDGVRVAVAHARPGSDMKGVAANAPGWEIANLLDAAQADVLFVGHTHVPFIRRSHPELRFVVNPGALLRDPSPDVDVPTPGTFAILEVTDGVRSIEIQRAATGEVVVKFRNG